jgi:multiple sugar transport system permease protein
MGSQTTNVLVIDGEVGGSATVMRGPNAAAPARRRRLRARIYGARLFLLLALPGVLVYALGILAPLLLAGRYSVSDINLLNGVGDFVGIQNYVDVLSDPEFWSAFAFTMILTLGCVVIANGAGVTLALILNRNRRSFHVLRSVAFIPSVLAGVVIAYIWSTILTDNGTLNVILGNLGLSALQTSWLGSQLGAQVSVIFVTVWPSIGFGTIIYLAGLQSVPQELLEAASVDGSGPARTFRSITWPLLRPALFVTTTMMVIGGFKAYDISVVLTGGGPAGATDTPAFQILRHGFNENRAGYANAQAIILLLALVIVSVVGVALNNRGEKS